MVSTFKWRSYKKGRKLTPEEQKRDGEFLEAIRKIVEKDKNPKKIFKVCPSIVFLGLF
jgi:hypothetical protein